jgi:drug/metabolite transporter (DMT)-like permease
MNTRGVVRCSVAALLFGVSTPLAAELVGQVNPVVLAGLLYLGAAVAVAPVAFRAPLSRSALQASWRPVAVAVVVGGALGPALLVVGLQHTSAATASLMLNFELVATVVIAAVLFREHLGRSMIVAVALITLAGTALVWSPSAGVSSGAVLVALACVCWGIDNNVTATLDRISPQHVTLAKGLVGGSANLVLGLVVGGGSLPAPGTVIGALAVGAFGYGVSITLWVKGARDLGAARGQVIFSTAPFVGALAAWWLSGTPFTAPQVVASLLAVVGVGVSLRSSHDHQHRHDALLHDHEHDHTDGHHTHRHHDGFTGRHSHPHHHEVIVHRHPHVPDLHHRHTHD